MISISVALSVVMSLVVGGLIFWLLWWLVAYCALPQPFDKVARVILAVLAVGVLCTVLLSLINGQAVFRP